MHVSAWRDLQANHQLQEIIPLLHMLHPSHADTKQSEPPLPLRVCKDVQPSNWLPTPFRSLTDCWALWSPLKLQTPNSHLSPKEALHHRTEWLQAHDSDMWSRKHWTWVCLRGRTLQNTYQTTYDLHFGQTGQKLTAVAVNITLQSRTWTSCFRKDPDCGL